MELKPKINLRTIPSIKCEECNSEFFREVVILKKVSKLLTGSSEDTLVPFPIYQCATCFHVNEELNPFNDNNNENEL